MFDRGLLSVADDERILLSNHINDVDGVRKILNASGRARFPEDSRDRPDPRSSAGTVSIASRALR